MTSFPRTVAGAIGVGLLYQVLLYNFPNTPGLVEFVLFLLVLVLVARISRADATEQRQLLVRATRAARARTPPRAVVGAAHAQPRRVDRARGRDRRSARHHASRRTIRRTR